MSQGEMAMYRVLRSAAVTIANMCGHTHLPVSGGASALMNVSVEHLTPVLATVGGMLLHDDPEILAPSLFGLRHLLPAAGRIESDVCDRLLTILEHTQIPDVDARLASLCAQGALLCLRLIVSQDPDAKGCVAVTKR